MLAMKGLVSISIPFFNREDFLPEAIESVLAQSYSQWELFLVDDGSTDRSSEIARDFGARWPEKIFYLEHPEHRNLGVTRTRNLGAQRSRGEYLCFLDSDDVWFPQKLELQVAMMAMHPSAALVYGCSEYWYDWTGSDHKEDENHIPQLVPGDQLYFPPTLLGITYPFGTYGAPCPSSYLVRKSAFDAVEGFVEFFNPDTFQLYEDIAFLSKIYLYGPVFVSSLCMDRYRCHAGSIWHRTKGTYLEESERRHYFRWLRSYLDVHPVADPATRRAIRKQAWIYSVQSPPFATKLMRRIVNKLSRQ
jgi:glycosyltransferase involved in cell wall biosynthesis